MEYIYIGKIINTHGIKGEIRIFSDFKYIDRVFKLNNKLFVGEEKEEITVNSYRKHKIYHMITFNNINDILEVLKYKRKKVYIKKCDLNLKSNEYLDSELIHLEAFFNNESLGKINNITNNNGYKIFVIKKLLIPYNENFIEKVDLENKKIIFKNVEGLIK